MCNMRFTVIKMIIFGLETTPKGLEERQGELEIGVETIQTSELL